MPRLPTILVIGSQAISTRLVSSTAVISGSFFRCRARRGPQARCRRGTSPGLLVASQQLVALLPPLGLFVGSLGGEAAQRADNSPVQAACSSGHASARRLVHEWHELV